MVVHTKTYREDLIENRETYARILITRSRPCKISIDPSSNMVGADLDENHKHKPVFRRNKNNETISAIMEAEEQEKYVNYRFNKTLVNALRI